MTFVVNETLSFVQQGLQQGSEETPGKIRYVSDEKWCTETDHTGRKWDRSKCRDRPPPYEACREAQDKDACFLPWDFALEIELFRDFSLLWVYNPNVAPLWTSGHVPTCVEINTVNGMAPEIYFSAQIEMRGYPLHPDFRKVGWHFPSLRKSGSGRSSFPAALSGTMGVNGPTNTHMAIIPMKVTDRATFFANREVLFMSSVSLTVPACGQRSTWSAYEDMNSHLYEHIWYACPAS